MSKKEFIEYLQSRDHLLRLKEDLLKKDKTSKEYQRDGGIVESIRRIEENKKAKRALKKKKSIVALCFFGFSWLLFLLWLIAVMATQCCR